MSEPVGFCQPPSAGDRATLLRSSSSLGAHRNRLRIQHAMDIPKDILTEEALQVHRASERQRWETHPEEKSTRAPHSPGARLWGVARR